MVSSLMHEIWCVAIWQGVRRAPWRSLTHQHCSTVWRVQQEEGLEAPVLLRVCASCVLGDGGHLRPLHELARCATAAMRCTRRCRVSSTRCRSRDTGLVSDAFHMGFHCLGLMASLAGMILSRKSPSFEYSYGYDRFEVLAAFAACTCLIFVSVAACAAVSAAPRCQCIVVAIVVAVVVAVVADVVPVVAVVVAGHSHVTPDVCHRCAGVSLHRRAGAAPHD
jgi:hypothetical protein